MTLYLPTYPPTHLPYLPTYLPTHPPTYLPTQTYYMSPRIPGLLSPFTTSIKGVLGSPVKHQLLYLTMFFNINVFNLMSCKA